MSDDGAASGSRFGRWQDKQKEAKNLRRATFEKAEAERKTKYSEGIEALNATSAALSDTATAKAEARTEEIQAKLARLKAEGRTDWQGYMILAKFQNIHVRGLNGGEIQFGFKKQPIAGCVATVDGGKEGPSLPSAARLRVRLWVAYLLAVSVPSWAQGSEQWRGRRTVPVGTS